MTLTPERPKGKALGHRSSGADLAKKINPIFGSNRLKLGVFGINGDSNSRTLTPERYEFNWENSLDIAEQADCAGLEAIVPYARFRSMVDPHHHSGQSFENFRGAAPLQPGHSSAAS